jgi:hypothetical protein
MLPIQVLGETETGAMARHFSALPLDFPICPEGNRTVLTLYYKRTHTRDHILPKSKEPCGDASADFTR